MEKPVAMQMESKLLKYLMQNYDREVRPVIDPKTAMKVFVGITLTQIFDMVSFDMHMVFFSGAALRLAKNLR